MKPRPSVTRKEVVAAFVHRGFTYERAILAYEAMCEVFSDAVVEGARINVGNVLSITPCWRKHRTVVMGFERKKAGVIERTHREYNLGTRLRYKVNLFRAFVRDHHLNWF